MNESDKFFFVDIKKSTFDEKEKKNKKTRREKRNSSILCNNLINETEYFV
jgi:hypothetical protein